MTESELKFTLETVGRFDFTHDGTDYTLLLDTDEKGNQQIRFSRSFQETKFSSWGELMNQAKVKNHYFKYVLREL